MIEFDKYCWFSPNRVCRGHLYRCHRLPIHCNRCFKQFKDEEDLKTHQRSEDRCTINNDPPQLIGFTSQQEKFLRSRKGLKGKDEASRWIQIYIILFPDAGIDIPDPRKLLINKVIMLSLTHKRYLCTQKRR